MANTCFNSVTFTGNPGLINILVSSIQDRYAKAHPKKEGFLLPFLPDDLPDYQYIDVVHSQDWDALNLESRWSAPALSLFIAATAIGVTFEMISDESSNQVYEAYRLTESGVPEYKFVPENLYPEEEDDDDFYEKLDQILEKQEWQPYKMDLSLLKPIRHVKHTKY